MADFIIIAAVIAYSVYLIVTLVKRHKSGGGCVGCSGFSCSGCNGSCQHEFDHFLKAVNEKSKKADKRHRA